MRIDFSRHARTVLQARGISEEWVRQAVESPAKLEEHPDGTRHFLVPIAERGGRVLRGVASGPVGAGRIVTAFFDRRISEDRL